MRFRTKKGKFTELLNLTYEKSIRKNLQLTRWLLVSRATTYNLKKMEFKKRAYRRYKKWCKFKHRLDKWTKTQSCSAFYVGGEQKQEIIEGKKHTWMRSMNVPCSCYMCSHDKYQREQKQYTFKNE